jgi:uncharacterized protein (DUF488 family)
VPERRAFTIGHSTHAIDAFVGLLRDAGVRAVADVRRFPGSRRHPQFGRDALAAELAGAEIGYAHVEALGGRRSVRPGSPNAGWEEAAFQGYADHMASAEFGAGLAALEALARERPTAVMCAEALWWQCHRRLVADALVARGWAVEHIGPDGRRGAHELTPFAVTGADGALTYPAAQLRLA